MSSAPYVRAWPMVDHTTRHRRTRRLGSKSEGFGFAPGPTASASIHRADCIWPMPTRHDRVKTDREGQGRKQTFHNTCPRPPMARDFVTHSIALPVQRLSRMQVSRPTPLTANMPTSSPAKIYAPSRLVRASSTLQAHTVVRRHDHLLAVQEKCPMWWSMPSLG